MPANAEIITLQNNAQTVLASSSVSADYTLTENGTMTVTLTDEDFPDVLSNLNFSLYSVGKGGATTVLDSFSAAGSTPNHGISETFAVTAGHVSTLFVAAAGGLSNVGMYTASVVFTPAAPVPLPAAGGMLGSAVAALGLTGLARRRRSVAA